MNSIMKWCEAHPKVIVIVAAIVVAESIHNFHRVLSWAESVEQIEASEYYGG